MTIEQKAKQTVSKLLQKTFKGELKWSRVREVEPLAAGSNDVIDAAYTTEYLGTQFALCRVRFQTSPDGETYYWDERYALMMIDSDRRPIWEFPNEPALTPLFKKVQLQAERVEDRLDRFLAS